MSTEPQFEIEKNEKGEIVRATLVKKPAQKAKPTPKTSSTNPDIQ